MFLTLYYVKYTLKVTCKQVISTLILKRLMALILSTEHGNLRFSDMLLYPKTGGR